MRRAWRARVEGMLRGVTSQRNYFSEGVSRGVEPYDGAVRGGSRERAGLELRDDVEVEGVGAGQVDGLLQMVALQRDRAARPLVTGRPSRAHQCAHIQAPC